MANLLYVDNSNLWIEGMHVAAAHHGHAPDVWTAVENGICDHSWILNFAHLRDFAGGKRTDIRVARLFGSRLHLDDNARWQAAERAGFDVVMYERVAARHEKKVDTAIVAAMIEDSYEILKPGQDEVTLVAGDADYVPAVERLRKRDIPVHVVFWAHAARELKAVASRFINLDPWLEHLAWSADVNRTKHGTPSRA